MPVVCREKRVIKTNRKDKIEVKEKLELVHIHKSDPRKGIDKRNMFDMK